MRSEYPRRRGLLMAATSATIISAATAEAAAAATERAALGRMKVRTVASVNDNDDSLSPALALHLQPPVPHLPFLLQLLAVGHSAR